MNNIKIYKKLTTRGIALVMSAFMLAPTLAGCKKKEKTVEVNPEYETVQTIVNDTDTKIDSLLPEVNDEISHNTSLVLLLELFTKRDENGKINADLISQFKSKLDVDNMISDFNSYLDLVQKKAINEGVLEKISTVLPDDLSNDRLILSKIESIVENIIKYSNEKNKASVLNEFNKIYSLIVEEKELEIDGLKFDTRDLSFPSRAVANNLAEIAVYYSRNYITKEQYNNIDKRANDQNNKAYIKQELEILSNEIIGTSETDVISLFNEKYESVKKILSGKVNLSDDTIKNLVNYMNIEYLDSDRVSTKDMNTIIGEYDEDYVNDVILGIDAINEYNLRNTNPIAYSTFLVENYKNTATGKIDSITLDFIQSNTIRLVKSVNSDITYDELSINPYFINVKKFFKGDDFSHVKNGESTNIIHAEISDGVKFIGNETVLYTLNKLPKVENMDNYLKISSSNLAESLQYLQNTITGECKRIDGTEYTLTK